MPGAITEMQGWAMGMDYSFDGNRKKEVKLKCQENAKNHFLKERIIPMILLYLMTMLTKLICILAVTFSV